MSRHRPMLIREPDIRWPIYLLAGIITFIIVLVMLGVMHLAVKQANERRLAEPTLQGLIRPGMPEFEGLRDRIVVEQLGALESARSLDDLVFEVGATVRNTTGRTISGLEIHAAVLDSQQAFVSERTVLIVPSRQTAIEPEEAINVRILLEGAGHVSGTPSPLLEVTGVSLD